MNKTLLVTGIFTFLSQILSSQVIKSNDFEKWNDEHEYDEASLIADDMDPRFVSGFDQGRVYVDNAYSKNGDNSIRVFYPQGEYGTSATGAQAPIRFTGRQEVYASYFLRFSEDFSWGGTSQGGKLPGLASGDNCSGGSTCDGTNGFSARLMWRTGGRAVLYLYHMDKPGTYGEDIQLENPDGSDFYFQPGEWHQVAERVKINTGNNYDGELDLWIDGELALSLTGIRFVNDGSLVDNLYFSTFHGGSGTQWAPQNDSYIWFDDLVIGETLDDVLAKECQQPNLGNDVSLCGKSSQTLSSNVADNGNYTFRWFKNGVEIPSETNNTLTVSTKGNYEVKTDSSGCTGKDEIAVLDVLPPVDLGDEILLCQESEVFLNSNVIDDSYSYEWTFNDNLLAETSSQLQIYEAGEYSLKVEANTCAPVTGSVTVSSNFIAVETGTVCPSDLATVHVLESGDYNWYTSQDGSVELENAMSYTFTPSQTTTIFVEDAKGFSGTVGRKTADLSTSGYTWGGDRFDRKLQFEVLQDLRIDSISFYPNGATSVTVNITDINTSEVKFTKTFTDVVDALENRVCLGAELTAGNYTLGFEGTNGKLYYSNDSDPNTNYPYTLEDYITITGSNLQWITDKPYYLFAYNWRISAGNVCAKTPVQVVVDAELPECNITSTADELNAISIYPNPTTGIVYLSMQSEYKVYNSLGVKVDAKNSDTIDLNEFPDGVYMILIQSESYSIVKTK